MGAYEFTALDARGREQRGVLEGDAPRQIRQQLRDKGWAPIEISEVSEKSLRRHRRLFSFQRGIGAADLALLTRQLATLVRSGLPLEEALRTVSEQTEKTRIKTMLAAVRSRILEGQSLASGLGDFPRVFSDLYRATIAAGEQSGYLDIVLDRLADYTENRQVLRQKLILSMIYPLIVVTVALLVVVLLLAYVVPQVVQVFTNIGQELPLLTRGLIASSDFVRAYGLWVVVLLFSTVIGLRLVFGRPGPRLFLHRHLLALPLIGRVIRGLNAARFARTLSILSESGVAVLEALRISAAVVTNLAMRDAVETAARQVREGTSLHRSLERSGYFPPMTVHLIASGEASGKLEVMLERAATSQERELESIIQTAMSLFGPLLILLMGGIVLLIVLAILLPIFDLNQLVL